MKCPTCKKDIPDNTLKCPFCKSRTGLVCKNCNSVNSVFDLTCKHCGSEILKTCQHCNSVNMPEAKKCRKCGFPFEEKQQNYSASTFETLPQIVSQFSAKNLVVKSILANNKKIFSLSGTKGCGKTVVLKAIMEELQPQGYSWLYGKCTQITQLTPGGLIQDILLNIFNLPNFCIDTPQFRKDFCKFFRHFPSVPNL